MSDVKKDERLEELMTEFLETTDENVSRHSSHASQTKPDSKKVLERIELQQNEIEQLKSNIIELKDLIREKTSEVNGTHAKEVIASDISALQHTVTEQSVRINEVINQYQQILETAEHEKAERLAALIVEKEEVAILKSTIEQQRQEFQKEKAERLNELIAVKEEVAIFENTIKQQQQEELQKEKAERLNELIVVKEEVAILKRTIEQQRQESQKEKAEHLNKLIAVKEEVATLISTIEQQRQESQIEKTVKHPTMAEIVTIQKIVSNQSTKIGDLEYKQKMLKTDLKRKNENRKGTFGLLGWLLLVSNVLLWSVVVFFIWSSKQNKESELVRGNSAKISTTPESTFKTKRVEPVDFESSVTPPSASQPSIDINNDHLLNEDNLPVNDTAPNEAFVGPIEDERTSAKTMEPSSTNNTRKKTTLRKSSKKRSKRTTKSRGGQEEKTLQDRSNKTVEQQVKQNVQENTKVPDVSFGD